MKRTSERGTCEKGTSGTHSLGQNFKKCRTRSIVIIVGIPEIVLGVRGLLLLGLIWFGV